MQEPNEMYARIQNVRVKNLEQQVQLMNLELQRIRKRILSKDDLSRLGNILKRLKDLNLILIDLRNHYNNMQQSQSSKKEESMLIRNEYNKPLEDEMCGEALFGERTRNKYNLNTCECMAGDSQGERVWNDKYIESYSRKKAGYDQRDSSNTSDKLENKSKESQTDGRDSKIKEFNGPFKTCKQLMDEIKPPGSILGNYLMRLQDFRTDPELRRQRWEKKQQEKLQQLQKITNAAETSENKTISTEEVMQNNTNNFVVKTNSVSSLPDSSDVQSDRQEAIKRSIDIMSIRESETDSGFPSDLPLIKNNLSDVIFEIITDVNQDAIALTIVLEHDNLYHISVSLISSAHSLSSFLATEEAIQEAKRQHLFNKLLTFFVVNAENSEAQKDRILEHSFEFIKMDDN